MMAITSENLASERLVKASQCIVTLAQLNQKRFFARLVLCRDTLLLKQLVELLNIDLKVNLHEI